jgi:hypothetical protein
VARTAGGKWQSDAARIIADSTQKLESLRRRAVIEVAIACLATDIDSKLGSVEGDPSRLAKVARREVGGMQSVLASLTLIEGEVDLYDLHVETFAAAMYSNLFRKTPSDGFFSTSRPFLDFEFRQVATGDRAVEVFGDIGFKGTASVTESNAAQTIQQSNEFFADAGALLFPNLLTSTRRGNIGVGVIGAVGFVGVPTAQNASTGSNSNASITDSFNPTYKGGIVVRQLAGHWIGSFSEFAYLRDPRFDHRDRTFVRGRLVFGRENSDGQGHGLSSFLEGSVNIGRGKDEARIVIGVGLDTEKILKAVLGLGSTQKEKNSGGN